jgi:hypothetical protein
MGERVLGDIAFMRCLATGPIAEGAAEAVNCRRRFIHVHAAQCRPHRVVTDHRAALAWKHVVALPHRTHLIDDRQGGV